MSDLPPYDAFASGSISTESQNESLPDRDVKRADGDGIGTSSNSVVSGLNQGLELIVHKGEHDFFRNDIVTNTNGEVVYYLEIPSPVIDLHVRWKFKLREGCDEGEVILTTRLIKEDEFELNFTGNNTGGWKRVLRKAGLIKKHWEIDSLEGGAYRWEKDEKVVKAGFVLRNKSKDIIAVWTSTKLSPTHTGHLGIYPRNENEFELILSSALLLEEICRRAPTNLSLNYAMAMQGMALG